MDELIKMHAARPYGSAQERDWVDKWIMTLPGASVDEAGNVWIAVGETSRTLFACHTDTVHRSTAKLKTHVDSKGWLTATQYGKPAVLGADDTAGCYIMRQMVLAQKPGLYIFHAGEEIGCKGSAWANSHYDFTELHRCISFDRRGTSSIITHQFCGRTCSDNFASHLAASFLTLGIHYTSDPTGIFTDSAEYASQIPECTNISVGYTGEHTAKECLYLPYVEALTKASIALDWEALPTTRDPKDAQEDNFYTQRFPSRWYDDIYNEDSPSSEAIGRMADNFYHDLELCESFSEVERFVKDDTQAAAALIVSYLGLKVY